MMEHGGAHHGRVGCSASPFMQRSPFRYAVLPLIGAALALLAGGCANPMGGLLVTKAAKEKEIAAVRAEYAAKLTANQQEAERAAASVIKAKDAQMVGAGGSLFAADAAFQTILTPTRTDLVVNNYVNEAWTALGRPTPDYATMKAAQKRLREELDEKVTTLAQLQQNHAAALTEKQVLADATKRHEAALAAAAVERVKIEREAAAKLDAKQQELIAVQGRVIAAEKARSDDAVARQRQLAKLSWGAGILAALCLAGAIWSPISKRELAIAAAVFAGAAVAIPFVEGWMVMAGVGVALAGVVTWALVKARKDEKLADSLTLGLQRVKDHAGETWQQVAPFIEDSLKRYVKRDGKIVAQKDRALEAHIDAKLAEYEALGPVPVPSAVVPAAPLSGKLHL
jgi:hypothetical protein